MKPKVTIVIPHYNGTDILRDCLESLYKNNFTSFETILIDNGSNDGSQQFVNENFKQVQLIQNSENRGYAGACNQGMQMAETPYILLLNNDTVMPENFLQEMINSIEQDDKTAMVQPKIISIQDKTMFDYSGGAGGEMDIFAYPFARGRIFDHVEKDQSQYDNLEQNVFWTSGCALLVRKSVVDEIGLLDEDFFAHQEEIDLNWRAMLAGYKNVVTTKTFIYHYSGYTLRSVNEYKMYLNHRNNLIMMLKNYSFYRLLILFPLRIAMEFITVMADIVLWDGKRSRAVLKALGYIFSHSLFIFKKHRAVQKLRKIKDKEIIKNMYPGSIVIDHFVRKRKPMDCVARYRQQVNRNN